MTASNSFWLVCLTLAAGLTAACSGDGMDTQSASASPDATAETPVAQVLKPPPGIDVDRSTAVGQVIDAQGRLGWYPHEGGLMRYRVNIRFGMEPNTMPDQWHFGRVSAVATDSNDDVFVFHRGDVADPIIVFDSDGRYQRSFGRDIDFANEHGLRIDRYDNVENITYDTLAGRIMRIDIDTGEILGAMESPGHWIDVTPTGEIFIGSLTGNVFRWYEDWLDTEEAAQVERTTEEP